LSYCPTPVFFIKYCFSSYYYILYIAFSVLLWLSLRLLIFIVLMVIIRWTYFNLSVLLLADAIKPFLPMVAYWCLHTNHCTHVITIIIINILLLIIFLSITNTIITIIINCSLLFYYCSCIFDILLLVHITILFIFIMH
jgi:hypothetical protein